VYDSIQNGAKLLEEVESFFDESNLKIIFFFIDGGGNKREKT
jgi:hypothetical protein